MLVDTSNLVSVTELGRSLSRYVNEAAQGRRFVILNSNTPTAAVVSIADVERLEALESAERLAAPAPAPAADVPIYPPIQGSLEQRLGMTALGVDSDGEPVYWTLAEHHLVGGRPGRGASLLFSAAIADAVPNPTVGTEFVVATAGPHVSLRHQRLHPEIPIAVEVDLLKPERRRLFVERLENEVGRRLELLREHQVDTIDELRQLGRKSGAPTVPNLVVIVPDTSGLAGIGAADAFSPVPEPILPYILKHGDALGVYLWLGTPHTNSDSQAQALLNSRISQHVSIRVAMGAFDSIADSREVLGTGDAANGPVPSGTGWLRGAAGQGVRKFAVVDPTCELGDVVTASGQCVSWRPGLTAPLALADIPAIAPDDDSRLTIPIGIVGNPPVSALTVALNEGTPHLLFEGIDGSGRTTLLRTLIAKAAMRYRPEQVTFMIVDAAGGGLRDMASMPNVAAYAEPSDIEFVERIFGEALRLIELRGRLFGKRCAATLDDYLVSRDGDPVPDDPYGRLVVVVDGFDRVYRDHMRLVTRLLRGGSLGAHLVATGSTVSRDLDWDSRLLARPVLLPGSSRGSFVGRGIERLDHNIPKGQPGRCIDAATEQPARIALPYPGHYDPATAGDHAARIEELVTAAGWSGAPAAPLMAIPDRIAPADFWRQVDADSPAAGTGSPDAESAAMDVRIPLGIDTMTGAVVDVPEERSPHLVAAGSSGSGRTVLMRALIASIRRRFSPDGADGRPAAKIALIDERSELAGERASLGREGYLLTDAVASADVIDEVATVITGRIPPSDTHTDAADASHARYEGPELFVLLVTPRLRSSAAFGGPVEWAVKLAALIEERSDLGLRVYLTAADTTFPAARHTEPLYRSLANAPTLLLSGSPDTGSVWAGSGIRFTSRPPGRGQLVDPVSFASRIVQIPWYQPE